MNGGETTTKESNSLRFFPMFNKDAKVEHRDEMPLQIGQETSLVVHFAKCCSPVPGDPIVGVLRPKIGIEVHNTDCPQLKNLPMEQRIAVEWSEDIKHSFEAHLTIETENRKNITFDVLQELKRANVFLERVTSASKHYSGRIRLVFKAFRKEQVDSIITAIKNINGVKQVVKS